MSWFRSSSLPSIVVLAVITVSTSACNKTESARTDAGRLGSVRLLRPNDEADALVFIFSDEDGWTTELDAAAAHLVERGAVVVGVDLRDYLQGLRASDDGCHYLISELEDMSERLQRDFKFAHYQSPILAGVGAGATLAYAALAQSPAATVGGAVVVAPRPELKTKVALCEGAPARAKDGGFAYGVRPKLPGWLRIAAPAPIGDDLSAIAASSGTKIADMPRQRRAVDELSAQLDDAIDDAENEGIAALPLTEIESDSPGPIFAVIYSGDGGWRDIDKQIGEYLAEHGVSVVGVDSLRYFWNERTPPVMARDLDEIIAGYSADWKANKVVLVGYSFGATVLPFAVNRLSPENKAKVVQVSLLGLEPRATFSIQIAGWFGAVPGGDSPSVLPQVMKLGTKLVQCFYGEEEEETLCRSPKLAGAEIIRTEGGHHFDGDYVALAERILRGARARADK